MNNMTIFTFLVSVTTLSIFSVIYMLYYFYKSVNAKTDLQASRYSSDAAAGFAFYLFLSLLQLGGLVWMMISHG